MGIQINSLGWTPARCDILGGGGHPPSVRVAGVDREGDEMDAADSAHFPLLPLWPCLSRRSTSCFTPLTAGRAGFI